MTYKLIDGIETIKLPNLESINSLVKNDKVFYNKRIYIVKYKELDLDNLVVSIYVEEEFNYDNMILD